MHAIKKLQNTVFAHRDMYMSTQMKRPNCAGGMVISEYQVQRHKGEKESAPLEKRVRVGQFSNEAERQAGDRL